MVNGILPAIGHLTQEGLANSHKTCLYRVLTYLVARASLGCHLKLPPWPLVVIAPSTSVFLGATEKDKGEAGDESTNV